MFTGSTWNAKKASRRLSPPATPGRMLPGFQSSMVRPSMPSVSSRYAICGCAIAPRNRCRRDISTRRTSASRVFSTTGRPSNRLIVRPSSCLRRSGTSLATRSTRGGEARAASPSVKARLSSTACSARATFLWRASASERTYAAVSDVAFFASVSSIFCPSPETGCAAPMCVPGAMAATSAAMVSRNPADAARDPDGATNTTTGARDEMMRETIVRVDSSSPPGVRRTKTTSVAFEVSASSSAPVRYSAAIGWMIPSNSATTTVGRSGGSARSRPADAAASNSARPAANHRAQAMAGL